MEVFFLVSLASTRWRLLGSTRKASPEASSGGSFYGSSLQVDRGTHIATAATTTLPHYTIVVVVVVRVLVATNRISSLQQPRRVAATHIFSSTAVVRGPKSGGPEDVRGWAERL